MTFQVHFCAQEASGSGQQKPPNVPIFEKKKRFKKITESPKQCEEMHTKREREKVRQRGRESEKSFPETVLTVGSRVCSKVSFL